MEDMYTHGAPYEEIGMALGISKERVGGRIRNRDYYSPSRVSNSKTIGS